MATMARDSKVEAERVYAQMAIVLEDYEQQAALLSTQWKSVELAREGEKEELKTQLMERERERGADDTFEERAVSP